MTIPTVIIVGADKGGVGKTMISRTLLDYFKTNGIENRAFDTENKTSDGRGVLKRFFPDKTEIVDLTDSDGQMQVFDTLGSALTLIDLRASLLSPTLKVLNEIGFIDPAKCRLVVAHVLGNTQTSIAEVKTITESIVSSRYIGIANHINDTKFSFPLDSISIPMLDTRAAESVDAASTSFNEFINSQASAVLRGYTKHWLAQVFALYDIAKLNT